MARAAENNKVLFEIITSLGSETDVVHFQIDRRAAHLASPTIALQDSHSELLIGCVREPNARLFWRDGAHKVPSFT